MRIGIAYDLKTDFQAQASGPDDALEEYDSPTTVEGIELALRSRGHTVTRLGGGRRFLAAVLESPPELVFNIAEGHGSRSREAHVPAVCEMLRIPHTHSDPLTMAVALDKAMAKRVVAIAGVPTPRFAVIESARELASLSLEFPLFAKPLFEGSSMGIRKNSRIANAGELDQRVGTLLEHYHEPVLVEEFCDGPEFTVAVLGTGPTARVVAPMEIVPKKIAVADFVYSLDLKRGANWREELEYVAPPRRDATFLRAIEKVALDAHRALGCRDISRVDVRVGRDGAPKFIEANPLPGIAPGWSDLALLWEGLGRTYEDLVNSIVDEARERLRLP
ncbi:MAG: D-alanine--D-alanine ligase [Planctomycetota bacterium]|nr:D-alanine--D-alanine ligase [Planctomycetota bacterium]